MYVLAQPIAILMPALRAKPFRLQWFADSMTSISNQQRRHAHQQGRRPATWKCLPYMLRQLSTHEFDSVGSHVHAKETSTAPPSLSMYSLLYGVPRRREHVHVNTYRAQQQSFTFAESAPGMRMRVCTQHSVQCALVVFTHRREAVRVRSLRRCLCTEVRSDRPSTDAHRCMRLCPCRPGGRMSGGGVRAQARSRSRAISATLPLQRSPI